MFIVNPVAGRGNGRRLADFIIRSAGGRFDPVIRITERKGHAGDLVYSGLQDRIRKFVAVGGDGTVNEVASALINTEGILGIIPAGSGNGLARHFRIPKRVREALGIAAGGRIRKMDYGTIDGHCFFCVGGIGFDAAVGQVFSQNRRRGVFAYALTTFSEYFRYRPVRYKLKIDGRKKMRCRAFLISFANASQYGNNAYISPGADTGDGLIDVCILHPFSILESLGVLYSLFDKKLDNSNLLEIVRCREVLLKRKNPGYIHYDGEPHKAGKKIKVGIVKHGLKIVVP